MPDAMTVEMGARVAAWARQAYPKDTAKLLSRQFGASPHTTKKWIAGCLPSNEHLAAMGRAWGKRFLAFIYEPVVGPWRHYAMDEELEDLKTRIAEIEREYADEPSEPPVGRVVRQISSVAVVRNPGEGQEIGAEARQSGSPPAAARRVA